MVIRLFKDYPLVVEDLKGDRFFVGHGSINVSSYNVILIALNDGLYFMLNGVDFISRIESGKLKVIPYEIVFPKMKEGLL